jgi:hypothetical protein
MGEQLGLFIEVKLTQFFFLLSNELSLEMTTLFSSSANCIKSLRDFWVQSTVSKLRFRSSIARRSIIASTTNLICPSGLAFILSSYRCMFWTQLSLDRLCLPVFWLTLVSMIFMSLFVKFFRVGGYLSSVCITCSVSSRSSSR